MQNRKKKTPDYVKRHVHAKLLAPKQSKPLAGSASRAWTLWSSNQRLTVLQEWCKMIPEQSTLFLEREWYALSQWVKKSLKKLFRTTLSNGHPLYKLRYLD